MGVDLSGIILDSISEGVYAVDLERRITSWNKGAERISGYSSEEVVGRNCSDGILGHVDGKGRALCQDGCPLAGSMADGLPREVNMFLRHRDGHRVPISAKTIPIIGPEGRPSGCVEIFSDRSDRSRLLSGLEALRKESLTDALTGLGNRRFADLSLERSFERLRRDRTTFGILLFDIDHFKTINDENGHSSGDRVLRMIGWTLANAVRRMDSAARWGGDEFIIVVPGVTLTVLAEIAERTRTLVERGEIILAGDKRVGVTVSMGGTMVRESDDAETLVSRADGRLYECKMAGRNRTNIGD
jgi:diguanylate cyclase (GGDEF)-like protein/PAS domain S-box-containing protein